MEKLFTAEVAEQIKTVLDQMSNAITIKLFVDGPCDTCAETKQLLEETAALSDKITLVVHEVKESKAEVKQYNIEMTPSFVFLDHENKYRGVKFNGFPGGHEINSFITAIMEMSGHQHEFSPEVLARVAAIKKPVDIKVFVTLSCPHCPGAVETAHRLAMLNSNITGQMIEAQTFQDISQKFKVSSVPKIVINDKFELIGNQPIEEFLKKIESM